VICPTAVPYHLMNEKIRILIDELCNIFSLYQTGPILCIKPFLCKNTHSSLGSTTTAVSFSFYQLFIKPEIADAYTNFISLDKLLLV
jgi:hypothetical protein